MSGRYAGHVSVGIWCRCRNHLGRPKRLYESYLDALKAANRKLPRSYVYPCPTGLGWHVTGRRQNDPWAAKPPAPARRKLPAGGSRNTAP